MSNLLRRLERLEQDNPAGRRRIVWIEAGESREVALRKASPLEPDESPVFVGWLA